MKNTSTRRYRALFISDVHLGTPGCQADLLLDFLRNTDAETIYLVGDIVDFWRIKRGAHWPQSHNDVLQKLLRKARKGARIVFIPGNHDEVLRRYCGQRFGGISVERTALHITADGRRFHVTHGDEFDTVVRCAKWVALLGDRAYELALFANTRFNWIRRRLGLPYWSLSNYLKQKVKQAVNYMGQYESALVHEAHKHNADGVICGHIHHAALRDLDGIVYANSGDWVESCTALAENPDGSLELLYWLETTAARNVQDRSSRVLPIRSAA